MEAVGEDENAAECEFILHLSHTSGPDDFSAEGVEAARICNQARQDST